MNWCSRLGFNASVCQKMFASGGAEKIAAVFWSCSRATEDATVASKRPNYWLLGVA